MPDEMRSTQEIHAKLSELRQRLDKAVKMAQTQKTVTAASVVFSLTREIVSLEWVLGRSSWEGDIKF